MGSRNVFSDANTRSVDGTTIAWRSTGTGPGFVIVAGMGLMAREYDRLASQLADSFTVHLVERRGRGASGPQGPHYAIDREVEDVTAVMRATGSALLFGHSYGGEIVLHAALTGAPQRVAVYDAAVSIDGSVPTGARPAVERAYAAGDLAAAQAILIRASRTYFLAALPLPLLTLLCRALLSGPSGKDYAATAAASEGESREVIRLDSNGERYRSIAIPTLLAGGGKSPDYLRTALDALAQRIPQAQVARLHGLGHFAPTRLELNPNATRRVAQALRGFLLARSPSLEARPRKLA